MLILIYPNLTIRPVLPMQLNSKHHSKHPGLAINVRPAMMAAYSPCTKYHITTPSIEPNTRSIPIKSYPKPLNPRNTKPTTSSTHTTSTCSNHPITTNSVKLHNIYNRLICPILYITTTKPILLPIPTSLT